MSLRRTRQPAEMARDASATLSAPQRAVAQTALSRHHTYVLLSRLYLQGLTAATLPYVQAIPELAQALTPAMTLDAAAADHYHLFGLNLFPYASAFADESGLLGGPVTAAVAAAYTAAGYSVEHASSAADHIGCQLAFLAFLNRCESTAWNASAAAAREIRKQQRDFLHNHVLVWMPPFAVALQRQERPFFAAAGELSALFISVHLADLAADDGCASQLDLPEYFRLDACREDEVLTIQMLARTLATPARSGLCLTRSGISRLARDVRQPHGFGGRRQMLLALLEAAQRYGRLEELLALLDSETAAWQESYEQFTVELPNLGPYVAAWAGKVGATRRYLDHFRAQLRR